jgi:hypothetical protein
MTDKGAPKRRAQFVYKRRDPEALRARWRRHQDDAEFDDRFRDAILQAYRENTGPLRDLLYSDTPLSSEHRELLAALIRWGIEPKGRGRPRGSVPVPNPARENVRRVMDVVRKLKLRKFGGTRVPKGELKALIAHAIQQLNKDDLLEGGINMENIRSELKRGAT